LSEASFSAPLFSEHRSQGGALVKAGTIVGVAFSLVTFLLAKQKKVTALRHEQAGGRIAEVDRSAFMVRQAHHERCCGACRWRYSANS
jgi:hypothetical protein